MNGGTKIKACLVMLIFLLVMACTAAAGRTIYVDTDAPGANDGSSWADAFNYLQDALADANSSDEIWVAQGTYKPDANSVESNGSGDRTATFKLINGVSLKGGYAGFGEADPNAKDIDLYETILSGDLKGDDTDVPNPEDLLWEVTRSDNSESVILAVDTDGSAGLEGFTVTAGNNPAVCKTGPCAGGAGLRNVRADPTIRRCTFIANAAGAGGGICNYEESNPSIINCIFTGNYAGNGGAVYGGSGLISHCIFNSNAGYGGGALWACDGQISDCIFTGNTAHGAGALGGSEGLIIDCGFIGNKADRGGALSGCHGEIINCVFMENEAAVGGVLYASENSPMLRNCTFFANSSPSGNAIACDSRFQMWPSNVSVTNCIFWDGGNEIWNNDGSTITVGYSDVQGGQIEVHDPLEGIVWGEGIVDTHPLFGDPNNGDYHVKSQGGRWDANEGRWTMDDVTSPCIDAGDPKSPMGYELFPNGGIINMGAYGGTSEASKSYFGRPPCEIIVAGDINGDCIVNFKDFALMAFHWLEDNRPVNSNSIVKDGIEYYIETDKSVYNLGEEVEMLYRVTNLRENPVDIGMVLNCDCWCHFIITDDHNTDIWQYFRVIPPCGWIMFSLDAFESREYQKVWDMTNDNGTLYPDDDFPVGGGLYNIMGELELDGCYERVPVSVSIKIL